MANDFTPMPIKSGNGGILKNVNLTPKTEWAFKEENYFTDAAAVMREEDLVKRFLTILAQTRPDLVNPETLEPIPAVPAEPEQPIVPQPEDRWEQI